MPQFNTWYLFLNNYLIQGHAWNFVYVVNLDFFFFTKLLLMVLWSRWKVWA